MGCRLLLVLVFLFISLLNSCCEFSGTHGLGSNLAMLEGDRLEDRVIVYCTEKDSRCCTGGTYVIPTYESHYDIEGRYAEYVETVESNNEWVVARSIQIKDDQKNYWIINKGFELENFDCDIINCDSILQTYVTGPLDYKSFSNKAKELNIDLELK